MSVGMGGYGAVRALTRRGPEGASRIQKGTVRRVMGYAKPYKRTIIAFLVLTVIASGLVAVTPILLRSIIDDGVIPGDRRHVVTVALIVAGLAFLEAGLAMASRRMSAAIGEGLIYDLRNQVFAHVLRQPIAFFTRAQTGALVSRLNTDVIGAQSAFTSMLSGVLGNLVTIIALLVALLALSPLMTLLALLLLPLFLIPAKLLGTRLAALTRTQMTNNAQLGARMTERFQVGGALLVKLFGRPEDEHAQYAEKAALVRDAGIGLAVQRTILMAGLTLIAALATALVYGLGGHLAIEGTLTVGTLVAMAALLGRLYQPLTALSNVRVDVMTAMVSFERVFEVLDLKPALPEPEDPVDLPAEPTSIELDEVHFTYPKPDDVSLASLESAAVESGRDSGEVLHGVSLRVEPGQLVALVGPSGAGKSTLTSLVARLHDPTTGAVRLGGVDLREASGASLRGLVGIVTQDAHMFHDTIRANLAYARPEATEADMVAALKAAQVWPLVEALPDGLDTVVGDRGHRLSGGEKQRLAIARLLLKGPGVMVLDEATAHLDSESEAAVQRALDEALKGRTSLVIAHRLSTVRAADKIVVLEKGRIVQQGTHEELLASGGLYAQLHRIQFGGGE